MKLGALLFLILPMLALAYEPPPLSGPVIDQAQIIDSGDEAYLNQMIRRLNDEGRAQLQILTVPSLGGEVLEQATIDTVEKYQLGSKEKDNGLLIFVAKEERKVRIEVGQGLEGNIPDLMANRIIEYKVSPQFREGQFGRGLIAAVGSIEALLDPAQRASAAQALKGRKAPKSDLFLTLIIFGFFLVVSVLRGLFGARRFGGGRSAWYGGLGGLGGGGFGGGFGGGGGGWSGGGGGFSGGGSSGGW